MHNGLPSGWVLSLVLLLICYTNSRTALSKSNCPSKFYIDEANQTQSTNQQIKSKADTFFSLYNGKALEQSIQKIVVQSSNQQLASYFNTVIVPYIIIAVIVFILYLTFCFCCIFQQSCPPDVLRRNASQQPFTLMQLRCLTAILIIFALGVIISCFLAFSYVPAFKQSIQYTTCSLYVSLDGLLNGERNTGWGGFNNLYEKIGNVSDSLSTSLPSIQTYLTGNEWLLTEMQQMKKMNLDIYSNNQGARLITPNPQTTKDALNNGLDIPTIESRLISTGLGPNGTFNTLVDDIDRSLRLTQTLSQEAYQIQLSANRVVDSSVLFLTNTASSQSSMQMYISQLNSLTQSLDKFKYSFLEENLQSGLYALEIVLAIELIGSLLLLMGVFGVYGFQIFSCRSMVVFGWVLYGLAFSGMMVILFVTMGIGSLGYGFCTYFDQMMTNSKEFNKLGEFYSQNIFNKLDVCFYGDGNVLEKFNLGQQISTITELFGNIQTYYDYEDVLSKNYIDKSISTSKISGWMAAVDNYKRGIYIDYDQSATTEDNPNYALTRLNLYTNEGAGVDTCSSDRWVFDSLNCTNPDEQLYIASTLQNGVALETTSSAICISFNEKLSTLKLKSWSQNDFTNRYKQIRQDCPQAYVKILQYGYSLLNFRDSRQNLFGGIYDQLDLLHTKNTIFNNNISSFKSQVQNFETEASQLNNIVANSIDGLLVSNDCRAIVDNFRFTYNMFCINSMEQVINVGWTAIFISVFSLINLFAGFIFSVWLKEIEKNKALFNGEQSKIKKHKQKEEHSDIGKMNRMEVSFEKQFASSNELMNSNQIVYFTGTGKILKQQIESDDSSQQDNPYIK